MSTMAAQQRGFATPYLKRWRLHRFMTQVELVEKSGVSIATIVRAERGDEIVSMANIKRLAEALDVSPDELVRVDPEASDAQ